MLKSVNVECNTTKYEREWIEKAKLLFKDELSVL